MKYQDLHIHTQREAPNNARTPGFALLVRAGYLTRENQPTAFGAYALQHLAALADTLKDDFIPTLDIPTIRSEDEIFFPLETGSLNVIHCPACGYAARGELALFAKSALPVEEPLPLEKVLTPACNTIEDLANFLKISTAETAKALLFTRPSDGKFVFVGIRGDMQLSKAKLKSQVGEVRPATVEEIAASGAVAGYASPIGLQDALIIVDDLIPKSTNLAAGANESGYHLKHVNYGRDYQAEIIADLVQAKAGDPCTECGQPLSETSAEILAARNTFHIQNILLALAETHHDERGLTLPHPAAPFDVYLMNIPGKTMDTQSAAGEIYHNLSNAGVSVLLDDREARAGVKFNDADLIGPPARITVGERGLQNGMVELKPRSAVEKTPVLLNKIVEEILNQLK